MRKLCTQGEEERGRRGGFYGLAEITKAFTKAYANRFSFYSGLTLRHHRLHGFSKRYALHTQ
jgi:hypothetical protein